jgi:hypothetical protein
MATTTTPLAPTTAPLRQINSQPKIVFSRRAWFLCWLYVNICDVEISFMGRVLEKTDDDNKMYYYIDDIFLLKQTCGPAETTIDATALGELIHSLPPEDFDRIRFWGHSHVNMEVYWSGTDYAAMKQLRGGGTNIYTVFNKKNQHRTCLDYVQGPHDYRIDDIRDVSYDKEHVIDRLTPIIDAYAEKYEVDADKVEAMLMNFMRVNKVELPDDLTFPADLEAFARAEFEQKVTVTKTYYGYGAYGGYGDYRGSAKSDTKTRLTYSENEVLEMLNWVGYEALTPAEQKKIDELIRSKKSAVDDWFTDELGASVSDVKNLKPGRRTRKGSSKEGRSHMK